MEGNRRPQAQGRGAFTLEAVEGLRSFGISAVEPIVLAYHPVARMNPFQSILYREAWEEGFAVVPLQEDSTVSELEVLARLGHRTVLHLHWLNRPMAHARSEVEAEESAEVFLDRLDAYRAAGGRIAWTIHNLLPHGARFEAAEARFRARVAERADVIHVMARRTPELVRPFFAVPADRILHVPHPAYAGAYEDAVGRRQARHELGIMPDELVFVLFGAIHPYKGLAELLDAWDGLPRDRPRRLLVAGGPGRGPGIDELVERMALHPDVLLHARKIPPSEVQLFMRSADIAVAPYLRSLNSGAVMLALTFDLPVIVPAGGGLEEIARPEFARTFVPGDGADLGRALRDAGDLATLEARAAVREAAKAYDPVSISRTFARGLRARLEAAGG